jgi:S-adenosylmethionine-dependent methyltransferase
VHSRRRVLHLPLVAHGSERLARAERAIVQRRDTSFDEIADAFEAEVYGTSRGRVRLDVLFEDLVRAIPALARGGLTVLDAGGGGGHFAERVARAGNRVVLADASRAMLRRAEAALREAGVAERVSLVHTPIQSLEPRKLGAFDLVTCHAVLEWVGDPADVLSRLPPFLGPQGALSLLFYNRSGAIARRVFRGEFGEALRELESGCAPRADGCLPLAEEDVRAWLDDLGLRVRSRAGIRIFHDFLPEAQRAPGRLDALVELEKRFRSHEPFASLAQHLHFVCERKG